MMEKEYLVMGVLNMMEDGRVYNKKFVENIN